MLCVIDLTQGEKVSGVDGGEHAKKKLVANIAINEITNLAN